MGRHQHIFFREHIVKRFKWREFVKIPKRNLAAIVINITPTRRDGDVLRKWCRHFEQQLTVAGLPEPYVVTQHPISGVKMLWKERRA